MSTFLRTRVSEDIGLPSQFLRSSQTPIPKPFLKAFENEPDEKQVVFSEANMPRRSFQPLVVMFIGRRGQGKTLAMTWLANFLAHDWRRRGVNRALAANYWIDFAEYKTPFLADELMNFPDWGHDLLACIDECQSAFPGRRSLAGGNVMFSNFLTQIRKLRTEIYFTTQFPQVMDWQILMQCDLFVLCEKKEGGRTIHMNIWDWWGQWTGNMFKKPFPPRYGTQDWEQDLLMCDKIWPHYNTEQFQPAMWAKNREAMLAKQWNMEADEPETDEELLSTLPKLPENMDDFLSIQPEHFSLLSTFDTVKRLGGFSNINAYARDLEMRGYKILKEGTGFWEAFKAKPRRVQKVKKV